jgi:CRP-like cAMP-binding protein
MPTHSKPTDNLLLAALAPEAWERLLPSLERVPLQLHQSLHESGQTMDHAYFPTGALVSLMYFTEDGASAESAEVGKDGMLGVSLLMGGQSTCSRAVVQAAGESYRLPADVLLREFWRGGAVMRLLLRYTQALLTQTSQRAICNRHHSVSQQLARCLLLSLDHTEGGEIVTTQERIAERLGVRREGVNEGAYFLQKLGLIRYARGHISVLDRRGLERRACECYALVKNECHRLMATEPQAA